MEEICETQVKQIFPCKQIFFASEVSSTTKGGPSGVSASTVLLVWLNGIGVIISTSYHLQ